MFFLYNILYVSQKNLNFIFQNQLQRKECFMQIVNVDIEINNHGIMTRRQKSNFYFLTLFNVFRSILILAAINSETIKM